MAVQRQAVHQAEQALQGKVLGLGFRVYTVGFVESPHAPAAGYISVGLVLVPHTSVRAGGCALDGLAVQPAGSPVVVPPLAAVVHWLGTVINAHLVSLALLPQAREVMSGPCLFQPVTMLLTAGPVCCCLAESALL